MRGARALVVAALFIWPMVRTDIGAQRPLDSEVKAAYLFNFARFVRWPVGDRAAEGPFGVCVIGRDPFGPILDTTLANERIDGRPVVSKRIADPDRLTGCHVLYVSVSEQNRMPAILHALNGAAVLTVSDIPNFTERGGMIQFVSAGNRIRFELNLSAAERAGLTVSSELSRVAALVHRDGVRP